MKRVQSKCYYTNNRTNGGQLGIISRTFCLLRFSRRRGEEEEEEEKEEEEKEEEEKEEISTYWIFNDAFANTEYTKSTSRASTYTPLSLWGDKQSSVRLTNWLCCLKSGEEFLTTSQKC